MALAHLYNTATQYWHDGKCFTNARMPPLTTHLHCVNYILQPNFHGAFTTTVICEGNMFPLPCNDDTEELLAFEDRICVNAIIHNAIY